MADRYYQSLDSRAWRVLPRMGSPCHSAKTPAVLTRGLGLNSHGFSLIELVMMLALLAILGAIGSNYAGEAFQAQRYERTRRQLEAIRVALIGDDRVTAASGQRTSFGFMGDWGGPPTALADLTTSPGTNYAYSATYGFGAGWRGPYLDTELTGISLTNDAWGNALVYSAGPPTTVTSYGSDGAAGTVAGQVYSNDLVLSIAADRWRGRVWGVALNGSTALTSRTIEIRYPSSGSITSATTTTDATNGTFTFSDIPFGARSIAITASESLGPKPIIIDTAEYPIPRDTLNVLARDINLHSVCCRLTLDSTNPVPTSDLAAQGTLYLLPYKGNVMPLYTGSVWTNYTISSGGVSVAAPGAASTNYDVFLYDSSGTLTLDLTAWTSDTARATALATQDGLYVKTGATARRYLGTVRTVAANQLEDSAARRFVWNHHNRIARPLKATYATASWTDADKKWEPPNANTTTGETRVEVVVGLAESLLDLMVRARAYNSSGDQHRISIDEDGTSANEANLDGTNDSKSPHAMLLQAYLKKYPSAGRHYYQWVDRTEKNTTTFFSGGMGMSGTIEH